MDTTVTIIVKCTISNMFESLLRELCRFTEIYGCPTNISISKIKSGLVISTNDNVLVEHLDASLPLLNTYVEHKIIR